MGFLDVQHFLVLSCRVSYYTGLGAAELMGKDCSQLARWWIVLDSESSLRRPLVWLTRQYGLSQFPDFSRPLSVKLRD